MIMHGGPEDDRLNKIIADGSMRQYIASLTNTSLPPARARSIVGTYAEDEDGDAHATTSSQPPTANQTIVTQPGTPTATSAQPHADPESTTDPEATTDIRSQLTINGVTFFGPLPPDQDTIESSTSILPPLQTPYRLFRCDDCPIPTADHDLCEPKTYPCIWSFPPKAREAYANRYHWYNLRKPLEETRLPNGRLPSLLDENSRPITKGLIGLEEGQDPNEAYDRVVRQRWRAVMDHLNWEWEMGIDWEADDEIWHAACDAHVDARHRMLECMSWRFDW